MSIARLAVVGLLASTATFAARGTVAARPLPSRPVQRPGIVIAARLASPSPLATPVGSTSSPSPVRTPLASPSSPSSASPSPSASGGTPTVGAPLRRGAPGGRSAAPAPFAELRTVQPPLVFAALSVDDAELAALRLSPDVAGAQARLQEAQYNLAATRAGIAPSFVSNYAQAPIGNPPGPNVISRQVTAGLQVTIGDFVAFSPALREAAFNLSAAEADVAAAKSVERVKVVGLYFDALRTKAVARAQLNALALANSQLRAARIRADSGDAPQLDVVRAEVAASKATADVETSTANDLNAREALGVETTTPDETLAATTQTAFATIDPRLTDPQNVIAIARARRPELISARLAADAARAAVRSARAAGFPLLTVSGGYLVGTDSDVPIHAPTINAQLTVPLGAANRDRVAAAQSRAVGAQTKALAIERQILLDVASSARTLGASERAAAATTRARQAAETELHATEIGYANGASSSLEVTFARQSYSQAVVDELVALYDLEKARATLDIEVGK